MIKNILLGSLVVMFGFSGMFIAPVQAQIEVAGEAVKVEPVPFDSDIKPQTIRALKLNISPRIIELRAKRETRVMPERDTLTDSETDREVDTRRAHLLETVEVMRRVVESRNAGLRVLEVDARPALGDDEKTLDRIRDRISDVKTESELQERIKELKEHREENNVKNRILNFYVAKLEKSLERGNDWHTRILNWLEGKIETVGETDVSFSEVRELVSEARSNFDKAEIALDRFKNSLEEAELERSQFAEIRQSLIDIKTLIKDGLQALRKAVTTAKQLL